MSARAKALLREPLLHFLVLGALVFGLAALVGEFSTVGDEVITVSVAKQSELALEFEERTANRPSDEELSALVDRWVDEEMLVREAQHMGLDRSDPVVRRRLLKQMEFVGTHLEVVPTPEESVLRDFWRSHPERYRQRDRFDVAVVQILAERGDPSASAADEVLTRVRAGEDPNALGHRHSLARRMTLGRAATTFGPAFAKALAEGALGDWHSVEQDGQWFVFRPQAAGDGEAGAPLPFDRVEQRVTADWKQAQRDAALQILLGELREKYRVDREARR